MQHNIQKIFCSLLYLNKTSAMSILITPLYQQKSNINNLIIAKIEHSVKFCKFIKIKAKKEELLKKQFLIVYQLMILNYCIALATSSAKFSSFFSIPSPVSNLTKLLTVTSAPISLETSFIY